ncbi:tripartite tricarboxylate transporter substrate binding protein [Imbroritus primus]|uniref:Tripartite tricarboxylate transporter substrate binding protein n=1 Tax=Imbroritus primus TaxID=3058603 RepID=A0ACD3SKP1_9BURK|nr:tripartite tricarboxylate transporter substrate binding protein [Burkholderiaceae bacterium PBA]
MNLFKFGVAAALSSLLAVPVAASADTYPSRPITIIVPFSAGGGTDMLGRLVAQEMTEILKSSVIVDNKAGASGQIGTRYVIQAPADGYTLLLGTTSLINHPFMFTNLPYDAAKQLRPIVSVADQSIFLAVNDKVPARDTKEFIAWAKKSSKVNYGSAGAGTTLHLSAEWLKKNAGFDATHIPFKGSGQSVAALGSGEIDFNMENLGAVEAMVDSKRVRLLAVAAPKRNPAYPNVPTLAEAGLPPATLATWMFLLAPAGTPDSVVNTLNKAVNQALTKPELQARLVKLGYVVNGGTAEAAAARMKTESEQWGPLIKAANITVQ